MRATAVRHSPARIRTARQRAPRSRADARLDDPCLTDPAIRRDVARFARAVDPQDLNTASERLDRFAGPALLVWGTADRFFKLTFARRLHDAFTDARLVEVDDGRTFLPLDCPPGSRPKSPPSNRPARHPPRTAIRRRSAIEPRAASRPAARFATRRQHRLEPARRGQRATRQPDPTKRPIRLPSAVTAQRSAPAAVPAHRHPVAPSTPGRRWQRPEGR